jgi:hypothetical protein
MSGDYLCQAKKILILSDIKKRGNRCLSPLLIKIG